MSVSVYSYTDFRKFLSDYIEYRKQKVKKLSLQVICTEVGVKSAGHLSLILQGKANISIKAAKAFTRFCKLKKREAEYFLTIVDFNQAKTHEKKREYFEQLISFRESSIFRVGSHQYKYYDRWYHSAIRAITEYKDVKENYTEIARMLVPAIRPDEVKNSLKLLSECGLIALNGKGFYRPTSKNIDTGTQAASLTVNNFAVDMLEKARQSMDIFPREERVLSWVTAGVDKEGYQEILQELREFRRKAAEIARRSQSNRVYQINIQAFPLTKAAKPEGGNRG